MSDTIHVDVDLVREELSNFVSSISNCASLFSDIQSNFIEGTDSVWNTPTAAKFIDSVCESFNNYFEQFNSYFDEGYNVFLTNANKLFESQGADTVEKQDLEKISDLAREWSEQASSFNVPIDYTGFAGTNLTSNIESVVSELESMNTAISNAVENGMDGQFCDGVKNNISSLITSANSVAEEYNSDAVKNAVAEDQLIQHFQTT